MLTQQPPNFAENHSHWPTWLLLLLLLLAALLSPLLWCLMLLDERAIRDWEMQPEERMQRTRWVEDCSPAPGHWPRAADVLSGDSGVPGHSGSDSGNCPPVTCGVQSRCHLWPGHSGAEKIPTQGLRYWDPHAHSSCCYNLTDLEVWALKEICNRQN